MDEDKLQVDTLTISAVLAVIKQYSKAKPVKSPAIEHKLGISGAAVREAVHYLRAVQSEPIGSDAKGYFYAKTEEELEHFFNNMVSRSRHILKAAEGAVSRFRQKSTKADDGRGTPSLFNQI